MSLNSSRLLRRPQLLRNISQPYICPTCQLQQRRNIAQKFLQRKDRGKEQWAERAQEIRAASRKSMLQVLEERGFVHQIAGERDVFDRVLTDKRCGVYCGIDPTAASLHIGHLLPLMALFWMHLYGFHTISLIGGSTSSIGDPTGRTTDRKEMTTTERKANIVSIHYQLKKLWINLEAIGRKHGYHWDEHWQREIVNNNAWWNNVPFLEVLKLLGRGLRIGPMLAKETVRTKLESGDGLAFSEFCYPIMQGWDWWHMYQSKGIQLQIGGADQYGNIVAGIDAVKYIAKTHPNQDVRQQDGVTELTSPYGFTVPLLTTASGEKFGKSAGNAVWLDYNYTSMFDLYGFFVRTADADVERLLKLFTFLPLSDIASIMEQHNAEPSKRLAQHTLAFEFLELVHGKESAVKTQEQHKKLFNKGQSVSSLVSQAQQSTNKESLGDIARRMGSTGPEASTDIMMVLPLCLIQNRPIAQVLHSAGLVPSRSEGHRLTKNGGAYIGRRPGNVDDMRDSVEYIPAKVQDPSLTMKYLIRDAEEEQQPGEEGLLILRGGKWRVRLVRVVSDDKFKAMLASGEVPEPANYADRLAEASQERANSFNAQLKLERLEKENQAQRRPSEIVDADEEVDVKSKSDTDGRGSKEAARRDSHQMGWDYLTQPPTDRKRRSMHTRSSTSDDAIQRASRLRAEYGPDRRRWPPLAESGRAKKTTPWAVDSPAKIGGADKKHLHKLKMREMAAQRGVAAGQRIKAKEREMALMREGRQREMERRWEESGRD